MALLPHDEILKVWTSVVSASLSERREALLTGVATSFLAGLPSAPTPGDQILRDLGAMNAVERLSDGSVPLVTWLANAVALSEPRMEAAIFSAALTRCGAFERSDPGSSSLTPRAEDTRELVTVRLFNMAAAREWTLAAKPTMTLLQLVGELRFKIHSSPWGIRGVPKPGVGYQFKCYRNEADTQALPFEVTVSSLARGCGHTLSLNIEWYRAFRGQIGSKYR